jgi:hypothetical protein
MSTANPIITPEVAGSGIGVAKASNVPAVEAEKLLNS